MAILKNIRLIFILGFFLGIGFNSKSQNNSNTEEKTLSLTTRVEIKLLNELTDKEYIEVFEFTQSYFKDKIIIIFTDKSSFTFESKEIDIDDFSSKFKKEFRKKSTQIVSISGTKNDSKI